MSRRECKKLLAAFAAATFCYVGAAQAETLNLTPSSTETFESYSPAGTTIVATSVAPSGHARWCWRWHFHEAAATPRCFGKEQEEQQQVSVGHDGQNKGSQRSI